MKFTDFFFRTAAFLSCGLWALLLAHNSSVYAQTIYQYKQDSSTICFFSQQQSQYIPHLMRKYQQGRALHRQVWGELPSQSPFMMLTDWADDGNAGVGSVPHTIILIGLAPMNVSYYTAPSDERYNHLFKHELTHVVMDDKAESTDKKWRNFHGTKVVPDSDYPLSALWSYLDIPRWFAPRWYHEGIACFMETWMGKGVGRSLGGYDEGYFRTLVSEGKDLFSIVGLETEGTTSDFQQGATSYLYGTRFVNYITLKYGYDKLKAFYNRTEGSKPFYADQFNQVYGRPIREVWAEWQQYEKQHQEENLEALAQYPLTAVSSITGTNLGAMSPMILDEENKVAFAAVNNMDDFAKIVRIDLDETCTKALKIKRIAYIDAPQMYQTAYLAYDKAGQRLIWTDRNSQMRGLVVYDLRQGRKVKHLEYQRLNEICYDNVNGYLYGIMSHQGINRLVRYDSSLENLEVLYAFPFGVSVSNLDVSHDGQKIVASLLNQNGGQSLILFEKEDMDNALQQYTTLYSLNDSNLSQFRFSSDDSSLVGFSYYTGAANIWEYNLDNGSFDLLSNTQTGLMAPYLASNGLVYALQYSSDGMTPVTFPHKILHDANSVTFLGQKVIEANPELEKLSVVKDPLPEISFGQVYDSITVYNPFKEIRFQGAYPDISAFTDRKAWNNMTPVLGYHFAFYDPLSLLKINLMVGASPWSNNAWKNRIHLNADIKYRRWRFNAAWNPSCFYDLFGPRRASRKGYQLSLSYSDTRTMQPPFIIEWGGSIAHYGDMDALPLYQDREIDEGITSFQTANLYLNFGKSRSTLGAVGAESGYSVLANAYTYLADGKFFPSVDLAGNLGFLLPVGHHNSFWLKGMLGQSFGDSSSSFGNSYFGGFRNNYVDNGEVNRYRSLSAMPGARIDQIKAHSYTKLTGEINFCPIRFNNFGGLHCYPNYIQFNAFANNLTTDMWGPRMAERMNYISAGAQMNIQLVLFTNMTTTLSFGYARVWGPNGMRQGEFMASLKLL